MKKLIAIDGNSLMHRAYYALPSMTAKDGTPTGAIYGFVGMLLKLLSYEPDYLLVAFDMHGPTFRHEQYGQYKAGSRQTPAPLRAQFPLLKELLREMGITICECERYEADDILGTISRIADKNGVDALLDYPTNLDALCLCANIRDTEGRLPIAPYAVHQLENGLRVGLVGVCTHFVRRWENPQTVEQLLLADPAPHLFLVVTVHPRPFAAELRLALDQVENLTVLLGLVAPGFELPRFLRRDRSRNIGMQQFVDLIVVHKARPL